MTVVEVLVQRLDPGLPMPSIETSPVVGIGAWALRTGGVPGQLSSWQLLLFLPESLEDPPTSLPVPLPLPWPDSLMLLYTSVLLASDWLASAPDESSSKLIGVGWRRSEREWAKKHTGRRHWCPSLQSWVRYLAGWSQAS